MYLKTCKKGEILFRQGDVEEWMYYIHQGKVGIFIAYGTENEQKVEELFSDQFVGDMGLLNDEPRSATAVTLENETVLEMLKEEEFETFFKENPSRVFQLMGQLSHRLRRTTRNYLDACKTAYNLVEKEKAAQADA